MLFLRRNILWKTTSWLKSWKRETDRQRRTDRQKTDTKKAQLSRKPIFFRKKGQHLEKFRKIINAPVVYATGLKAHKKDLRVT